MYCTSDSDLGTLYTYYILCLFIFIYLFVTEQDIFSEIDSNDSQYVSGESSERQTPQPVSLS